MRKLSVIVGLLLLLLTWASVPAQELNQVEFKKATTTLLCDCGCHPQSVDQCACGRAAEMRDEMAALVRSGMSGQEIIDKYVAEKGEQIRIAPTATGFNLVAWLGPLAALVAASLLMIFVLRRWSRTRSAETDTPTIPAAPVDDAYQRRLQDAIENME